MSHHYRIAHEFQGRQVTDVYERASGNIKANKNVGNYYNVSLGDKQPEVKKHIE